MEYISNSQLTSNVTFNSERKVPKRKVYHSDLLHLKFYTLIAQARTYTSEGAEGGGWCGGVHTQTDRFVKREHYGQPKTGGLAKTREQWSGGGGGSRLILLIIKGV